MHGIGLFRWSVCDFLTQILIRAYIKCTKVLAMKLPNFFPSEVHFLDTERSISDPRQIGLMTFF